MEERKKVDRLSIIKNLILVAFVVILVKILYMTTFKYEHYTELAENKTYKQLLIKAPRGEIKDRYGRLLAGNKNLFTVQVSGDEIKRKDKKVFVIRAHKSQVCQITICQDCVSRLDSMAKYGD